MSRALWVVLGIVLLLPVIGARLLPLAWTRLGWIVYGANIVWEVFVKRLGGDRFAVEAVVAALGIALVGIGAGISAALAVTVVLVLLELGVRRAERRLLTAAWTRPDRIGPAPKDEGVTRGLARGYPSPSVHPKLTINLTGPFISRWPRYRLGTLVAGRHIEIEVLIGNHTIVPTQTGIRVDAEETGNLRLLSPASVVLPTIPPGSVQRHIVRWEVARPGGPQRLTVGIQWGDIQHTVEIAVDRCIAPEAAVVEHCSIVRYPGARRAAFAWRGDMDLYDTSTLQSVEGLHVTLDLAARYRMPQTMYLSTRLSLDEAAARAWEDHWGVDRGASEIPRFIEWMRENVDLVHRAAYPFQTARQYLLELGNHGHLHFGTDTAAAPDNGWKVRSKIGAGRYPWLGEDHSSFGEQCDNAMEARRWCEKTFGFTPKSWAMPDRTRDEHTPAAMEAAGCEVLSDSDIKTVHNVLLQPPPHLPPGCSAVELTKRYPGDPEHIFHVAMNLFWIHRAHRLGIPVVFMCHQHMRQFEGHGCARFTEGILRHVLDRFNGDLWINTVYGIGVYWRDVLSKGKRVVEASAEEDRIEVSNRGRLGYSQVPVDVVFAGGGRATYLVDLPEGKGAKVTLW